MIYGRDLVPKVYGDSRDYQSILALLDLMIETERYDTQNFINLLNPRLCPNTMLPLLASYVGYEYDSKESVSANRTIIEYFPALIRNKGSEIGISLATALSVNALADNDALDMLTLFHIEYKSEKDENGLDTGRIYIYIYYPNYLDKIRDMIEVVRPAGVIVELIPAIQISSIEQIRIYDEWRSFGYEYVTGKLIRVDNHEITMVDDKIVNACYEIYKYSDDTNSEYYVSLDGTIINSAKENQGYLVLNDKVIKSDAYSGYKIVSGVLTATESDTTYNGYSVSNSKILRPDGSDTGYTVANNGNIMDSTLSWIGFTVVNDMIVGKQVGYLEKDINSKQVIYNMSGQASGYYVGNLPCIMAESDGRLEVTKYHVNKKGDVVDNFGNVALSWIDRYHIAESHLDENGRVVGTGTNRIGFSEVASRNIETGLRVDTFYYDKDQGAIVSVNNGVIIGGVPIEKYQFRDNRDIDLMTIRKIPQPYNPSMLFSVSASVSNGVLIIDIPTLYDRSTRTLHSTDQYDKTNPDTVVNYKLFTSNNGEYSELQGYSFAGYERYEYISSPNNVPIRYTATKMSVTGITDPKSMNLYIAAVDSSDNISDYTKIVIE